MLSNFISSAVFSLQQLEQVLDETKPSQYSASLSILFGSSIGMHVRHTLEFYQCLIQGLHSGKIHYDGRERNLQLEHDIDYAKQSIQYFITKIEHIEENTNCLLICSPNLSETEFQIPTNILRELNYLIEHSIHHMAILKMAYSTNFPEITIPQTFGIAYSTLKHLQLVHSNLPTA